MLAQLIEWILPYIVGIVLHQREKLTKGELDVRSDLCHFLGVPLDPVKKPVIVAIIGLVGSGKSSVADCLAQLIGAAIVSGDEIRTRLREVGEGYGRTRAIAEDVSLDAVKRKFNVILDSDFSDPWKRASLRAKARKAGVRVVFIRTYCDLDVMIQRMRHHEPGEFFDGASTKSTAGDHGKDVKIREMIRRLPHHYRRVKRFPIDLSGGKWVLRKPPCKLIADIDTTNHGQQSWRCEVERTVDRIKVL